MKHLSIIAFLIISLSASAVTDSFLVDGVYRNYILHLPSGYNVSNAYPLVLNLHGYTSNAAQEELYTNMDASADANAYIVVYPNGIANYWNSWGSGANDVKFLGELIDTISARYHVNSRRVYSCGISNGGYMSYTLACSMADRLAAIASVSGTMSNNTYSTCNPARKIPVMHIHGTSDATVPYATGAAGSIGAEQTVAFWRDTDACTLANDTTFIADSNPGDGCTVQRIRYQHCPANNEVLFYKIIGGGHTWPGGVFDVTNFGNTNHDISATDEIWNFFNRYSLDGLTGINEISTAPSLRIAPNPAANQLNILTDGDLINTTIYELCGREVLSVEKSKSIDIEHLMPGMYIATISASRGQRTSIRFVKQ
jgi:polyhydroxybutyrate depolymerase